MQSTTRATATPPNRTSWPSRRTWSGIVAVATSRRADGPRSRPSRPQSPRQSRKSYCLLSRAACVSDAPGPAPPHETKRRTTPPMATAESVVKPDFQSARKHFIFTDEHEALRESIRNFAIKELAPHAEEWEETTFPDSVFRRMGELGLPRPRQARGVRRAGRGLLQRAGAGGGDHQRQLRRPGDGRGGADGHGDAADPRSSAPRSRSSSGRCPAIKGEKILCLGITEPDAG